MKSLLITGAPDVVQERCKAAGQNETGDYCK